MFHKLVRISRFPYVIRTSYSLINRNRHIVFVNLNRLYGSGSDPDKDKKVKQNICITSRKSPYDICDPGPKRPCIPTPPPYNVGPRKCPNPNRMDLYPKPDCPYDEYNAGTNKTGTKRLILGLIALIISLGAAWYSYENVKESKEVKLSKKSKLTCKIPKPRDMPNKVPYLLIGGGTASFSAFRAIKSNDPTAKVLVISNECYFPYMRPPLSKELWYNNTERNIENLIFKQWNGTERSLFYEPNDFYLSVPALQSSANGGVAVAQGYNVKKIDVVGKKAYLDDDVVIEYDKCLIATGGTPRNLDIFAKAKKEIKEKITLYRDILDFQDLYELTKSMKAVAIIGGGFLGSELACALGKIAQKSDMQVFQIYKEGGNMGKILPQYLSEWTTEKVRNESVRTMPKTKVEFVEMNSKQQLVLHLNTGNEVIVDHVIVALGIEPNTQLAKTSELEVDPELGGFLVNAEMEARSNLYIAGDCSCFYDVKLGRRRVEHHDHAVVTGRLAGENMTGAMKHYTHQSMFWSDLGPNIGYEAIGLIDSRLPTVAVFAKGSERDTPKAVVTATDNNLRSDTEEEGSANKLKVEQLSIVPEQTAGSGDEFGKGVVFYLRNDIVVGIVLWNVFNRMSIARQVLKEEKQYDDLNEVAKLFNIHGD